VPKKGKGRGNKSAKRTSSALSPDLRGIKYMCLSEDVASDPNVLCVNSLVSVVSNASVDSVGSVALEEPCCFY